MARCNVCFGGTFDWRESLSDCAHCGGTGECDCTDCGEADHDTTE